MANVQLEEAGKGWGFNAPGEDISAVVLLIVSHIQKDVWSMVPSSTFLSPLHEVCFSSLDAQGSFCSPSVPVALVCHRVVSHGLAWGN